jgi:hypothetical protein
VAAREHTAMLWGMTPRLSRPALLLALSAALSITASACGGNDDEPTESTTRTFDQAPEAAADPQLEDFPRAQGRTMQDLADLADPGFEFAPATSHYVTGINRLAFGVVSEAGEFVYGPTAVYVGRSPDAPAQGPFVAPSDSLVTEPAFRSKQAALEGDAISSIYSAELELPQAGDYSVLVLTRLGDELLGATSQLTVANGDTIPAPGEAPPQIETDTLEEAGGQIAEIDTREPPDDLHSTDFADVVGERPVALLFATPQLCASRVCGPVTDIALQLREEYGDQVEFIHQEVYVDNDPNKGLRPPLEAFRLETEPWLFTFGVDGEVAARLEGSFGFAAFEAAVREAL